MFQNHETTMTTKRFQYGDIVEFRPLTTTRTAARAGALAQVVGYSIRPDNRREEWLKVIWVKDGRGQSNGYYEPKNFALLDNGCAHLDHSLFRVLKYVAPSLFGLVRFYRRYQVLRSVVEQGFSSLSSRACATAYRWLRPPRSCGVCRAY